MAFSELVNFRVVCVQVQNIPGTIHPTHASSFRNKRWILATPVVYPRVARKLQVQNSPGFLD